MNFHNPRTVVAIIVAWLLVLTAAVIALWPSQAQMQSPRPAGTPASPAAFPVTATAGDTMNCPPPDTCLGGTWKNPPAVTIDNQIGPWFVPILQRAISHWQASGIPLAMTVAYGGPAACENRGDPPPGTVVFCLHDIPSAVDADTHKVVTYAARIDLLFFCDNIDFSPRCPIRSGVDWLLGPDRVGVAQFERNVIHEVGHVTGLGDNPSPASVMFTTAPTPTILASDVASIDALYAG